jgi:hypothetical protein
VRVLNPNEVEGLDSWEGSIVAVNERQRGWSAGDGWTGDGGWFASWASGATPYRYPPTRGDQKMPHLPGEPRWGHGGEGTMASD